METLLIVALSVSAVPATVPVKVVVYVPGVEVSVTLPNDPVLVPTERLRLNELLPSPLTAFPVESSTTMVTVSPVPEASDELAKPTVVLEPLTAPEST